MPLKNFPTFGDLQGYEYIRGFITAIDYTLETCSVEIKTGGGAEGEEIVKSVIENVPFYYHCNEEAEELENGGLRRGVFAFRKYDEVVLLKQIPGKWNAEDDTEEEVSEEDAEIFVIAYAYGPRRCGFPIIISTASGDEAIAWDLIADAPIIEKADYDSVKTELMAEGYDEPVLAEPSGHDEEVWDFQNPILGYTLDAYLNLPILWHGEADGDGLDLAYAAPWPYLYYEDDEGNPVTGLWYRHYYLDAPAYLSDQSLSATESIKAPYFIFLHGTAVGDGDDPDEVASEFEDLTGMEWPIDPPAISLLNPLRQYLYFHSMFDYELDTDFLTTSGGIYASKSNMDSFMVQHEEEETATEDTMFFDSWRDCLWELDEAGDPQPSLSDGWIESGIATANMGDLTYEFARMCFNAVEDEDDDTCEPFTGLDPDDYPSEKQVFRVFVYPTKMVTGFLKDVYDLINAERTSAGLKKLKINLELMRMAERHCYDMASNCFLSHTGSDGSTFSSRYYESNYLLYMLNGNGYGGAENAEYAGAEHSPEVIVETWMNSPGHAANVLTDYFTDTGLSMKRGFDNKIYFCQVFGFKNRSWPGLCPVSTIKLRQYLNDEFEYSNIADLNKVPKIYIV